eukprot:gene10732-biopygen4803
MCLPPGNGGHNPGRNGHARVRSASGPRPFLQILFCARVRSASGPRPLPFLPGREGGEGGFCHHPLPASSPSSDSTPHRTLTDEGLGYSTAHSLPQAVCAVVRNKTGWGQGRPV